MRNNSESKLPVLFTFLFDAQCAQMQRINQMVLSYRQELSLRQSLVSLSIFFIQDIFIWTLKHSQYKNDATQLKNFYCLKLPPFFLHRVGDGKRRQFQNQEVDCTLEP